MVWITERHIGDKITLEIYGCACKQVFACIYVQRLPWKQTSPFTSIRLYDYFSEILHIDVSQSWWQYSLNSAGTIQWYPFQWPVVQLRCRGTFALIPIKVDIQECAGWYYEVGVSPDLILTRNTASKPWHKAYYLSKRISHVKIRTLLMQKK